MRTIASNWGTLLPFLDLFAALCGNGMLESMLEPHLKYAGAGTVQVGVSFLVFGCCYMLGNVLFGGVCATFLSFWLQPPSASLWLRVSGDYLQTFPTSNATTATTRKVSDVRPNQKSNAFLAIFNKDIKKASCSRVSVLMQQ